MTASKLGQARAGLVLQGELSRDSNKLLDAAYGTTPDKVLSDGVCQSHKLATPASLKNGDLSRVQLSGQQMEQPTPTGMEADHDLMLKTDSKSTTMTTQESLSSRHKSPSSFANLNPQICGNSFCPTVIQCI